MTQHAMAGFLDFTIGDFFGSLLITVCLYSLPIIIYRYGVKKEPVGKKKARNISIIYGIIAFIIMSLIVFPTSGSGASVFPCLFWGGINYLMLCGNESDPVNRKPDDEKRMFVCSNCGSAYSSEHDETYCPQCKTATLYEIPYNKGQWNSLSDEEKENIKKSINKDEQAPDTAVQHHGSFINKQSENNYSEQVVINEYNYTHNEQEIVSNESERKVLFCRKCGTPVEVGDVFCTKCGTKLV